MLASVISILREATILTDMHTSMRVRFEKRLFTKSEKSGEETATQEITWDKDVALYPLKELSIEMLNSLWARYHPKSWETL